MITLVDSNVILDLVTDDPKWAQWSADALSRAADESRLPINPLIFAEISIGFPTFEEVDHKAFLTHKRRGGRRTAPLADFYIGAHAAVAGMPC
jgi:predicted nucleic acid-binding protein